MAYRVKCFFALLSVLCVPCAWAGSASCGLSVDALVARSGSAQIGVQASAASTSVGVTPELALVAVGRLSAGDATYSVWRIRNVTAASRVVVLRAVATLAAARFNVAAHSDLFVRSDDTRGPHALLAGPAEVDVKIPAQNLWHDSRLVSDPLCAEPGSTLWVQRQGAIMRISPVDGQILFEIATTGHPSAPFAVDPIDGSAWIYSASQPQHVDLAGRQQPLPSFDKTARVTLAKLTVTPQIVVDGAHRLWIGAGRVLLRLSDTGVLSTVATLPRAITQLSFDPARSELWVTTGEGVYSWATAGAATAPSTQFAVPLLHLAAADTSNGGLWVTTANRLRSYEASGQLRADAALPGAALYTNMAADLHGGVWLTALKHLVHYTTEGVLDVDAAVAAPSAVAALSIDDRAGVVWLSTPERLWEYSEAGQPLPMFGSPATDAFAPAPGLLLPLSRRIEGMQIFVDNAAPELAWSEPAAASIVNLRRPDLIIVASDQAGHLDPGSFGLMVSGVSIPLSCTGLGAAQFRCLPGGDLPEGQITLTISVADDSGNVARVDRTLTIDTVAPGAPVASLIHVRSAAGGTVEVDGAAASVEGGATVMVRDSRTGASVSIAASPDGSFVASIAAPAGDLLELTARDAAGNSSAPLDVAVQNFSANLALSEPADGITTSAHDLVVRGTLTGVMGGGVTINGHALNLIGPEDSSAFSTRVALAPGENSIDVVAHLPDNTEIHAWRTITLSNPDPFGIRVSLQGGVAPMTAVFAINAYTGLKAAGVDFDFDGDGVFDAHTAGDSPSGQSYTYASPGMRDAAVVVTGDDGSRYRYVVPLSILSSDELDQHMRIIWTGFRAALASPDPTTAASYMEPELASRMGETLQDLRTAMPSIAASLSEPVLTNASSKVAEYAVTRVFGSDTRVFLVYFRLDADGIWRLAAL